MKNFGEFFNNQIESANTIILSRTQNESKEKLDKCIEMIRQLSAKAHIITTPWDDLEGIQILSAMENATNLELELLSEQEEQEQHHHHDEEECDCGHDHEDHEHHHDGECGCGHDHEDHEHDHHDGECGCGHDHEDNEHDHHDGECGCGHDHSEHEHHEHDHHDGECGCGHDHSEHDHHHHDADEVFHSWGVETPNKYEKDVLEKILAALSDTNEYGQVLRAKGMVPQEDGSWMYFDLVPGEYEIRVGKPDFTGRICVIGANLEEDKLKELFSII